MLLNQMLPITLEVVLSNLALLYFCGPIFFFNSVFSLYFYGRVTRRIASDRKSALQNNYKVERDAFGLLHESVQNAFNLRVFQAGQLERVKYIKSTLQSLESLLKSNELLTKMNLQQRLVITYSLVTNLGLGIFQVSQGVLSTGDFVFLNFLMIQVFQTLFNLGNVY